MPPKSIENFKVLNTYLIYLSDVFVGLIKVSEAGFIESGMLTESESDYGGRE